MELRHLRYFTAVAERLHFGRAAEALGIAQPPLSQQIQALEEEIGVKLFSRSKRHVELTAAGAAFFVEAKKTLEQAERATLAAQRAARGETGHLVIGFVSSAVYGEFPDVLRMMRSRFPDVSLTLRDLASEEQVEAVQSHQIDVGFVRPPVVGAESLDMQIVWREPFVVALPQNHRLAKRKRISAEMLADEPFLQVPRKYGPGLYDQVSSLCAQAGFAPRIVQEALDTQTLVSLVAGGMGVSLLPGSMQKLRRKGVAYRPFTKPEPMTDLAVLWRPGDESPALKSFLKIVWRLAKAGGGEKTA